MDFIHTQSTHKTIAQKFAPWFEAIQKNGVNSILEKRYVDNAELKKMLKLGLHLCIKDNPTGGYNITLLCSGATFFTMTLTPYPCCCAMWQVTNFKYVYISKETVDSFMDILFKVGPSVAEGKLTRYVVAM